MGGPNIWLAESLLAEKEGEGKKKQRQSKALVHDESQSENKADIFPAEKK